MVNRTLRSAAIAAAAVLVASCASAPATPPVTSEAERVDAPAPASGEAGAGESRAQPANERASEADDRVVLGTGDFVQAARGPERAVYAGEDGVTLNFERAELNEFLRVIFDTILKQNYIVDPSVSGTVTLHTTRPITIDAVIPTVESVLLLNDAALLFDDGVYRVVPLAAAPQGARAPSVGRYSSNRDVGFGFQVVPLQHASASEIQPR